MPGWRVGFMVGNPELVAALGRLKSYFDYGTFTPIQVASILALEGPQECVQEICDTYRKRRDVLVKGLNQLNWQVPLPKATMFVWASIPERYKAMGSLEFSKKMLTDAKVAVSPGVGFGEHGDEHVRFSLIENEPDRRCGASSRCSSSKAYRARGPAVSFCPSDLTAPNKSHRPPPCHPERSRGTCG